MKRYPDGEWVPWRPQSPDGQPTYWPGVNKPIAVVLHIMVGWATTARQWATEGHYGASWHFTVARDGSVMQHLDLNDAGYQAGIPSTAPNPVWRLWRGHGENVNWYSLGIEHEGFPGEPFTDLQAAASKRLCQWLAGELGIPLDYDHFPPHAAIDVVNRVNDFNVPALRDAHYGYLFAEEDDMATKEQIEKWATDAAEAFVAAHFRTYLNFAVNGGPGAFTDSEGEPLRLIVDEALTARVAELERQQAESGPAWELPDHKHTPGGIQQ